MSYHTDEPPAVIYPTMFTRWIVVEGANALCLLVPLNEICSHHRFAWVHWDTSSCAHKVLSII